MLFAQSLGEYGALGSIGSTIQNGLASIFSTVEDFSATTWVVIVLVVAGLFFFFRRP